MVRKSLLLGFSSIGCSQEEECLSVFLFLFVSIFFFFFTLKMYQRETQMGIFMIRNTNCNVLKPCMCILLNHNDGIHFYFLFSTS